MRFSRFIIGLTSCIAFSVQAANVDEYITQLPAGANLALMVQKVGASAPAIDYHSQQMALPASTQKVITALAALIQLGPDFRFTTTLETKGNVENGVLKGELSGAIWCRSDVKTSGYSQYGHDFEKIWRQPNRWQCVDRYLHFRQPR